MRYSGHEWFPCRYAWLPKAIRALADDAGALREETGAVEKLGIGKNMVRALVFWATAMGVIESTDEGHAVTPFGDAVFGADGLDPFLEDIRTLWLLHWRVATTEDPLFAWDFLLNRWHRPEIVRSVVLPEFIREANSGARQYSETTLKQHFDVFMQVYTPVARTRAGAGEDHLDSPLVELGLIEQVGERTIGTKREPVYAFRREPRPEIPSALFALCLADFWRARAPSDRTLSLRDVAVAPGSPGQILKLPEADVRDRLESIAADTDGVFSYQESAAHAQATRPTPTDVSDPALALDLLRRVYEPALVA